MSNYTYKIGEDFSVSIFNAEQEEPVIFQPNWPDTTPWAGAEEAAGWAELYVDSINNPDFTELPGYGPEEPSRPRPEPVDPSTV